MIVLVGLIGNQQRVCPDRIIMLQALKALNCMMSLTSEISGDFMSLQAQEQQQQDESTRGSRNIYFLLFYSTNRSRII